ncbi:Protein-only RNase P C-terminal [Trinorchestia longiramus]|nr:Protein-only RNase P C-terminal [Trinorchestia longiramus]
MEPSTGVFSLFLEVCGHSNEKCDEDAILEAYRELDKEFPIKSEALLIKMINALCKTSQYHLISPHLQAVQSYGTVPTTLYVNLAAGAFRTSNPEDGWQWLDKILPEPNLLLTDVVLAFVVYCNALKQVGFCGSDPKQVGFCGNVLKEEDCEAAVVRFLQQLQKWQVFLDLTSMRALERLMISIGFKTTPTTVSPHSGKCRSCGAVQALSPILPDSFAQLTEALLDHVLKKDNIYLGSTPIEWLDFKRFLDIQCPFTHVLDGLNIAYRGVKSSVKGGKSSPVKKIMVQNLIRVVEEITAYQPDAKPLVICRIHMVNWDQPSMKKLREVAHVYFLENLTADDSFFLYAALRSGVDTKIITSDMLRNHAFLLKDIELQRVFKLWQQRAQLVLTRCFPVELQLPNSFTTTCQPCGVDGRSWHIPYNNGSLEQSYDLPRSWLCAQWSGGASHSTGLRPLPEGRVPSNTDEPRTNFRGPENALQNHCRVDNKSAEIEDGYRNTATRSSSRSRSAKANGFFGQIPRQDIEHQEKSNAATAAAHDDGPMKASSRRQQPSSQVKSSTVVSSRLKHLLLNSSVVSTKHGHDGKQ